MWSKELFGSFSFLCIEITDQLQFLIFGGEYDCGVVGAIKSRSENKRRRFRPSSNSCFVRLRNPRAAEMAVNYEDEKGKGVGSRGRERHLDDGRRLGQMSKAATRNLPKVAWYSSTATLTHHSGFGFFERNRHRHLHSVGISQQRMKMCTKLWI